MSVIVYTENWEGKFKKSSYELVSYAHSIATELGVETVVVSIGQVADDQLNILANYGANKILSATNDKFAVLDNAAYASVIARAAKANNAKVIVFANNFTGKAVSPRVAVKLEAGLANSVTALPLSLDPFVVQKNVFNGKALGKQQINSDIKVISLAQNSFEIKEVEGSATIEAFDAGLNDAKFDTQLIEKNTVSGKIILTDAELVVSGGRGMKSADNWSPLEELAAILGAGTACSRPVADEGWRPHAEHVGQTGKIIAPNLYIALGISGAIQHLAGVSSSKIIVAVNTDPEAPFFEAADYGILGDVHKVLPLLVEAAKSFKAHQ
ncbi:MAG: electron transfer flavoprotein subunit alpha/FixB family protein [Bacteroidales bacterium]|jgi:electron transfer flavoprotein alpha subunit|nr:electron transfer flavoprotein subunit alpha/FixB family protein [Bacteroidales bacterium]